MRKKATNHSDRKKPFWQSVIVGALHCGSGCTLGDILAESILFHFPVVLFGRELFGSWAIDYILAFLIGIVFQYYAIKPIKDLTRRQAIVAALKADTLSLTSWQIGMYGWMAVATFLIFRHPLSAAGSGVLAHNADRYANGLHYRISSQLVVVEERN